MNEFLRLFCRFWSTSCLKGLVPFCVSERVQYAFIYAFIDFSDKKVWNSKKHKRGYKNFCTSENTKVCAYKEVPLGEWMQRWLTKKKTTFIILYTFFNKKSKNLFVLMHILLLSILHVRKISQTFFKAIYWQNKWACVVFSAASGISANWSQ